MSKAKPKKLTLADVEIRVLVEQDTIPVRGNALASGDDAEDKACEDEILARLNDGDAWAWAMVTVEASYMGLTGIAHMGGCSYRDEKDFRECFYFGEMETEALADLQRTIDILVPEITE